MQRVLFALFFATMSLINTRSSAHSSSQDAQLPTPVATLAFTAYQTRFDRACPVVAVIGENSFTELTDYVIPYAVMVESGVAEVRALATEPGPIQMFPALKIEPQATIAEFDARFPKGADYVIVPAVHAVEDPTLLAWVTTQAAKGATFIGVCDGVWVLGHAGLLKGRSATGHWYSLESREQQFPETTWVSNRRYVSDGNIVTTTGVSASIPVSLALVEAIAGRARAEAMAKTLDADEWSPTHHSEVFYLSARHIFTAAGNWLAFWKHEDVGVPVAQGVDEMALALVVDAYSRTYRSSVYSVAQSQGAIQTKRGLTLLPDSEAGSAKPPDRLLQYPKRHRERLRWTASWKASRTRMVAPRRLSLLCNWNTLGSKTSHLKSSEYKPHTYLDYPRSIIWRFSLMLEGTHNVAIYTHGTHHLASPT